jgi:hypothetical protein
MASPARARGADADSGFVPNAPQPGASTASTASTAWIDYREVEPLRRHGSHHAPLPSRCIVELPADESAHLGCRARAWQGNPYDLAGAESLIRSAQQAARHVFSPLTAQAVERIANRGVGAVLLANLPVDPQLPPSPVAGGALPRGYKSTSVSEYVAAAIATLVDAEVFNFRQEGRGSAPLFDNVVPLRSLRHQHGAGGYANDFPFHCESAFHRLRPDYSVIVGMRVDPGARTLVSSIEDLLATGLEASMPEGSYRLKPPDLYRQMDAEGIPLGTPELAPVVPLAAAGGGDLRVNFNGTDCRGWQAVRWLSRLETAVEECAFAATLAPGSALLVNNHRTCHTRSGFSPDLGPDARWFVRANLELALWPAAGRVARCAELSPSDEAALIARGWIDGDGQLTKAFQPLAEEPRRLAQLSAPARALAAKALHRTPAPSSRIV